jgi:hypothetical protein
MGRFLALAFARFLSPAQAQTIWHLKLGTCTGMVSNVYADFGVRPMAGVGLNQRVSAKLSCGADLHVLWHSLEFGAVYGGQGAG